MGSVYQRGDSWVIEYRKPDGRMRRESIGKRGMMTKTIAREILQKRERNVKLGKEDMLDGEIPSLGDFAKEYLSYVRDTVKKRSWKRDELCLRHLIAFYGNRQLPNIKPQDVDEYKASRLMKVSPATVNRELEVLRYLFNLADRWNKYFGKNPVSRAGLLPLNNQKERILNFDEEKRLLDACDTYLRNIVITALYTGMRKGEIISLKWEHVDFDSNTITIDQMNSKSKKTRRIPINSDLRTLLLNQRLKSAGSEYVFHSSKGTPYLRQDSLNRAFMLALRKAKIEGLRFHDLRHTAATRMIESGASIVAVSKILGHADLKTTMRYTHPEDSLKDAVELLVKSKLSDSLTDKSTDMVNKQIRGLDVSC
jgi:integrase